MIKTDVYFQGDNNVFQNPAVDDSNSSPVDQYILANFNPNFADAFDENPSPILPEALADGTLPPSPLLDVFEGILFGYFNDSSPSLDF